MRLPRPIVLPALALALIMTPSAFVAAEELKVEVLKEGPPADLSPEIKAELLTTGYRVTTPKGKPYADFWLRKATPASAKPGANKGNLLFPNLAAGELFGVLRFAGEGHDYRDQPIPKGTYTLRYGIQPENGAHLGVSEYRDYALLLPAAKDKGLAKVTGDKLSEESAQSAGTTHPAILMLLKPSEPAGAEPVMVHDENKDTWGAVVPLGLAVKGESAPVPMAIQLVLGGVAMN